KDEPGFEALLDEVVVCGFAVLDNAHERLFLQTVKSEHSILSINPYRCIPYSAPSWSPTAASRCSIWWQTLRATRISCPGAGARWYTVTTHSEWKRPLRSAAPGRSRPSPLETTMSTRA